MKTKLHTETKTYIECPNCGDTKSFSVGHLRDEPKTHWTNKFGTWYCDNCGCGIEGEVLENGDVEIELTERTKQSDFVLLELPPSESVFLVVKGMSFESKTGQGDDYFYNEHTCPINYFHDAVIVMCGNDTDPHGLFKYRGTIPEAFNPQLKDLSDVEEILDHFRVGDIFRVVEDA